MTCCDQAIARLVEVQADNKRLRELLARQPVEAAERDNLREYIQELRERLEREKKRSAELACQLIGFRSARGER